MDRVINHLIDDNSKPIYADYQGWFKRGPNAKHPWSYDSDNPHVIVHQIKRAGKYIDGFTPDWYGFNDQAAPTHLAVTDLMHWCEELAPRFEFNIMLDSGIFKYLADTSPGGIVKRQQILTDAVKYALDAFLSSPAYSRVQGKRLLWEFGLREAGVDMSAVTAILPPDVCMLYQNAVGPDGRSTPNVGSFAWVAGFPDGGLRYLQAWCDAHVNDLTPTVPCIFWRFDDRKPGSVATPAMGLAPAMPAQSIWGGPARSIDAHFGQTFAGCIEIVKTYCKAAKNCIAVAVDTWNDVEEGTGFEDVAETFEAEMIL